MYLSKYILKKQSWILKIEDGNMRLKDYIEYEAEIDARTGVFYKWEIDRD